MDERIVHYIVLILLLYCIEWAHHCTISARADSKAERRYARSTPRLEGSSKASRTAAVHGRAPFAPSLSASESYFLPHKRPLIRACSARSQAHPYSHPGPPRSARAALVRPCPPPTHPVVHRPCPSSRTASAPRDAYHFPCTPPTSSTNAQPARPPTVK